MTVSPAIASARNRETPQSTLALKQIFKAVNAESCPHFYNFHMHTVCSDGRLTPEALMEQSVAIQLLGMAITDHHSIAGYKRALTWMEDWRWRHPASLGGRNRNRNRLPRIWPGVEINGLLADTEVHLLGYGFRPDAVEMEPYLQSGGALGELRQAHRVINAIQSAGGLAVLAHPARYRTRVDILITAAANLGIDGVETYYAYDNPEEWRPSPRQTAAVSELANQFGLLSTCGTDTHGPNLLRRL